MDVDVTTVAYVHVNILRDEQILLDFKSVSTVEKELTLYMNVIIIN